MATKLATTREVFDHHMRAVRTADMDALMSDYTDASVMIGPDGIVKGKAAIRQLFDFFLSGLLKPGTCEITLDKIHVDGEILYVLWHAVAQQADITFAADTFVIRDGKIAVQTFAPKLEPKG